VIQVKVGHRDLSEERVAALMTSGFSEERVAALMSSGFGRRRRSRRRSQPEVINFQRRTRDRAWLAEWKREDV